MPNDQGFTLSNIVLIVATIALLSTGQVLFKVASQSVSLTQLSSFLSLSLLGAVFIYALATVAWLIVLSRSPLSVVFPFYGLGFFFVPVLSALFLGEHLKPTTFLGAAIIAAGIFVSSRG